MAKSNAIIIKRIKKAGHGGHHGGAWKVAYADFVTAMMAFFLLLWLLNATTDAQKRGIADYFSPTLATRSLTSGAGGVLGGRTVTTEGAEVSNAAPPTIANEFSPPQETQADDDQDSSGAKPDAKPDDNEANGAKEFTYDATAEANATPPGQDAAQSAAGGQQGGQQDTGKGVVKLTAQEKALLQKLSPGQTVDPAKLTEAQFLALKEERESKQFTEAQYQLQQAIQQVPDLKPLAQNLVVDRTAEGLRIQLVDQDKSSMFALGSTEMNDAARKLMGLVAQAIAKLPNKVSITGHTDSTPFQRPGTTDNWDLSTQRANASRRALIAAGLPEGRVATVLGKADTEPFVPQDPNDPRNRRVSIVVLRDAPPPPPAPEH
jgi:chemotaxis protein MotB